MTVHPDTAAPAQGSRPDPGPVTTRYHFVLTVQWPDGEGLRQATRSGAFGVTAADTRSSAFDQTLAAVVEQLGITGHVNVLCWTFEPDELPVAGS